ncbi:MAG: PepSY domain-containing protein [Opitutaceae bacterium]|jgi:uncharacterized iron-regulated membrane protein|nr:PepSY domain-containing protein [Opitutaceae bacterium]
MLKKLRTVLFWAHLVSGLITGIVVVIMSFTGAALAFQKELVAWAESDVRHAAPSSPGAAPLPLDELLRRARQAAPDFQPATIAIPPEAGDAHTLAAAGRGATAYYQNQYTGELKLRGATKMRAFMQTMFVWHRWLGLGGDSRPVGKAITGACNAAFIVLAITGIYLWWPRSWSWRALRPSMLVLPRLRGRARDWNWHTALGFWSAPVLIILTITALPISYRWAGNLIYAAFGETPPVQAGPPPPPPVEIDPALLAPPVSGAEKLTLDALLLRAREQLPPGWEQITLRLSSSTARGGPREQRAGQPITRGQRIAQPITRGQQAAQSAGQSIPHEQRAAQSISHEQRAAQSITLSVLEAGRWPRTAATTYTLNVYTGDIAHRSVFADNTPARRLRTWTRFLHTGEALGWPGRFVAGLACIVALVLCYTGFALSYRRFFRRKNASLKTSG